ncbi:MAG: NAD-dependent epimerase/dehydratase family protein, partial [bacterium]|nr:NAD-dependent epimerase/dehydratase family protein [bacterium]
MKSKKVLIIGGGGFLGHCLIEELRKDSFEPYIFDIQGGKRDDGITVISGDRHNYHDLAAAREYDFDCVVDLIAYRPKETELAIKVFSGYTGRFVHISTFSAYQAPEISPFDESHPLTADGSNTYMNRKADCERLLEEAGRTSGFPFVVVRSAPVFGPHDNVSRENYYLKRMKTGQPIIVPGDAKTPLLTVFVRDLIKTVALAVSNEAAIGKAFHAAQREMVSLQTHIMEIGRLSGLTPEILPVNEQLLAAAGFNLSAFPYYSGNALYADTSAVRDVLGLEQTTYKEAMKETMSWLLANDPLNQPSWPGRITMQARMAATNDTIQYLKEKTFV